MGMAQSQEADMKNNSVSDFAQAAAQYAQTHFEAADTASQPDQWAAPVDDDQTLGMRRNPSDGGVLLTAWRRPSHDDLGMDDVRGEALLRHTFYTRLGAGLLGGISHPTGVSLSLPLYGTSSAAALQTAAEHLLQVLDRLDSQDAMAVMPDVEGDARYILGDPTEARSGFERLARACNVVPSALQQRSFDLLFGDLPGRVTLHPADRLVLVDFFLYDAVLLQGSLRRIVIKSLLDINQAMLDGHAFAVGLDSRDFVTSTGRLRLDRLDDAIWPSWLRYQVEQALATRALIKHLSFDGAEIQYGVTDGSDAHPPG